ncbi:MAG: type II secretion system protein GspG [Planctomycetes bacterium]|nr:type II secretion system protein GspG [Planctomycetota bacterium]
MAYRVLLCCVLVFGFAVSATAQDRISRTDRTKMRETRETMRSLAQDLRAWSGTNENKYPEKLQKLVDANLRDAVPKDAWGNEFSYSLDEEAGYKLVSLGGDGKLGGEGGAADITFTRNGEKIELNADQQAELEKQRDAARHEARVTLARARMVAVGIEVVQHRREKGSWPAKLEAAKRTGTETEDKAVNACFLDPWGNEYAIRILPQDNLALVCWGADGVEGGTGRDVDFVITERDIRRQTRNTDEWGGGFERNMDWQVQNLSEEVQSWKQQACKLPDELIDLTRPIPLKDGKQANALRNNIPSDEWGREYIYLRLDDENFAIVALGKDGVAGGMKEDADHIAPMPGSSSEGMIRRGGRGMVKVPPNNDNRNNEGLADVATEQMRDIAEKLKAHKDETGKFPDSLDDIKDKLAGGEVPNDPWDRAFTYELSDAGYTLTCLGSDGEPGGEGHAADITWTHEGKQEAAATEPEREPEPVPERGR